MAQRAKPYDRDAALESAMILFWNKGYNGVSLKDLERTLNMKPGSIYAAFSSKERLFLLTLERYFKEQRELLASFATGGASPLEGLVGLLRRIGANAPGDRACRPCFLMRTLLDSPALGDAISEAVRSYLDQMDQQIRTLFIQAKSHGALEPGADTALLAQNFHGAMTVLRTEAFRGSNKAALAALAEHMASTLVPARR
ncbi:MAG: TetR/AcrR family transcriptional regulator [Pseudomonadota bacterium]